MASRSALAGLVCLSVVLVPSPAMACDPAPGLPLDEVAEAGPHRLVPHEGIEVRVRGIVEHRVAWRAPALIPFTSQRASYLPVRSWGQHPAELPAPPGQRASIPYVGGLGSSCGPIEMPAPGSSVLRPLLDRDDVVGQYVSRAGHPFQQTHDGGLGDEDVAALTVAFGDPVVYEPGVERRLSAFLSAWGPHVIVFAAGALAVTVMVRGRARRSTARGTARREG